VRDSVRAQEPSARAAEALATDLDEAVQLLHNALSADLLAWPVLARGSR
jgi:hypothetical protein